MRDLGFAGLPDHRRLALRDLIESFGAEVRTYAGRCALVHVPWAVDVRAGLRRALAVFGLEVADSWGFPRVDASPSAILDSPTGQRLTWAVRPIEATS